jgi:hypothetical protein
MNLSIEETEFRQKCKIEALRQASGNKPQPNYSQNLGGQQQMPQSYDLLKEAEKIYQWLIKEDVTG